MAPLSRDDCEALDRRDPLAAFRDEFFLPAGIRYFDGNSLGPLPRATPARVRAVVEEEWGEGLVRGWVDPGWIHLPRRIGERIAAIVGAAPDEVIVTDSTSVNLFKVVAAALALRPGRPIVLSERENFPTDLYMMQGLVELAGGDRELRLVPRRDLDASLDDRVAVVVLTHVDFKTGALHDMETATARAHARGALAVWDLSHSAGAMPLALDASEADFAVGCGYKYLNGGPGAPAYVYVARRLQAEARQPLSGWMGHRAPFEFATAYDPAAGIARWQSGTPVVLGLAALEVGVDLVARADLGAVRDKSVALGDLFLRLADERLEGFGLEVACPRDGAVRGSQVSLRHDQGYAIVQALIARGVIPDFRAPDHLRFGLTPLYMRFADVWDAVEILREVLAHREWDRPAFQKRAVVT